MRSLYLGIVVLMLSVVNCREAHLNEEKATTVEKTEGDRFSRMRSKLLGKKIKNDAFLLGNELPNKESKSWLILFTDTFDCTSCIYTGLEVLEIDLGMSLAIISNSQDTPPAVTHQLLDENLIFDTAGLISDSFGVIHTPVLLLYSSNKGVEDAYFVPLSKDEKGMNDFLMRLKSR